MPKKIKFESFVYRFCVVAHTMSFSLKADDGPPWSDFVRQLHFDYERGGQVTLSWRAPVVGQATFSLKSVEFYVKGDNAKSVERQRERGLIFSNDTVKEANDAFFAQAVKRVATMAGYEETQRTDEFEARNRVEREFHDAWADGENLDDLDVMAANEVCTAPEMRYITDALGDLHGKTLFDLGCGLGEASVYFAMLGAEVTSSDLSPGMLRATTRLADANGVTVSTHLATAEDLQLSEEAKYDVIYAGNLLHHVDIEQTIKRVKPHLAEGGVFVTWDPLAYNPMINIYRVMASAVRTPDEHPLRRRDLRTFRKHFSQVKTEFFWLSTLNIFVAMAVLQRRNPSKERYWKSVVKEGDRWAPYYKPLEKLDRFLLKAMPPLRMLCWNVVVISKL